MKKMARIRPMEEADLAAVGGLDAAAFGGWRRSRGGGAALGRRTAANLRALLERDPGGSFLAVEADRAVGYVFSRTWGGVGWVGPIGVLPALQGRGIGTGLLGAAVDYLRGVAPHTIGLETMPESPDNLDFYFRRGFDATPPTLLLTTPLRRGGAAGGAGAASNAGAAIARWSRADECARARWAGELAEASGLVRPGLDYTKEIDIVARYRWGDAAVLIDGGRAAGVAVVSVVGLRAGRDAGAAGVQALVIGPQSADAARLRSLVTAAEEIASAAGRLVLHVPVNAAHSWALRQMLQWGYRVERPSVRMVLAGTEPVPPAAASVDFSRWAG